MRKIARHLVYELLFRSGYIDRVRKRGLSSYKILIYHSVAPEETLFTRRIAVTVTPETFRHQLSYLKQHYTLLPLPELTQRLERGSLPEGVVAITFDDGFRDNYEYAWPILQEFGLSATIFVATDAIVRNSVLWMHKLTYLANVAGCRRLLALALQMFGEPARSKQRNGSYSLPARSEVSEDVAFNALMDFMVMMVAPNERDMFLNWAAATLECPIADAEDTELYLTPQQIQEMAGAGIEFGNHTCSHPMLAGLSPEQQALEIGEARTVLEDLTNQDQRFFAYPFGETCHYTSETRNAARKHDYRWLLAGHPTPDLQSGELGRIKVEEEPLAAFAARIEGVSIRSRKGNTASQNR